MVKRSNLDHRPTSRGFPLKREFKGSAPLFSRNIRAMRTLLPKREMKMWGMRQMNSRSSVLGL
jgi:hypothetical protein